MSGGLGCSRMPSVARSMPETVFVLSQAERTMLASGADALAHSTSIAASSSSLLAQGFLQLGYNWVKLQELKVSSAKFFRKVVQSLVLARFVSSMSAIVTPLPVKPCCQSGRTL